MKTSEELEKIVIEKLKRGVPIFSASVISSEKLQELALLGAHPMSLVGWMNGFGRHHPVEKYKEDEYYKQGFEDGTLSRQKLESKFSN